MSKKTIHHIKEIFFIALLWVFITFLYVFIKFSDIPEDALHDIYGVKVEVSIAWILWLSLLVAVHLGIILGVLYSYFYPYLYRTQGFWVNIVVRVLVFTFIALIVFNGLSYVPNFRTLLSGNITGMFIYMLLTEMLIGILVLIRRNIGSSYFLNTVLNTYRTPKEEERIFMFLDMQDSTPIAEKMGHLHFSRYIQDCFYDLSQIVLEYDGEIYQFVGDEAVITWKVSSKNDYRKCIDLYFDYMSRITNKRKYYLQKYGTAPIFKCALHSGKVSTALVGDYKKEIAFHGNVLNLCSRLQVACKKSEASMLISENFYKLIKNVETYSYHPICLSNLKGIEDEQIAYYVFRISV